MVMLTDALNIEAVRVVRACVRAQRARRDVHRPCSDVGEADCIEQDEWCEIMSENGKAFEGSSIAKMSPLLSEHDPLEWL
jgi:hypothetical protein